MKILSLVLVCVILAPALYAQQICINGDVTHGKKPTAGVLVMAFDKEHLDKKFLTDENGEYLFRVDGLAYDVVFYKPGLKFHVCRITNKLERELQSVNISVEMTDSTAPTSQNPVAWFAKKHINLSYIDSIYASELEKHPVQVKTPKLSHKQIMQQALAEQKRFSNYKTDTREQSVDNHENQVTTITIGPDMYEMITNDKGEKKYVKNDKPITEVTYRFETTRRYEGVLKNEKNVKHFDKYKPQQHVKGNVQSD